NQSCHLCGVSGNQDPFVTCCVCKVSHVHLYCLHKKVGTVPDNWYCEECKALSRFQRDLPDHIDIHATWKGSFEILDSVMGGTFEGLQAHLPRKGRCKAYEVANAMPNILQLKLHPRSDVWPHKFDRLSLTDDDIAFYFLPNDKRFTDRYQLLSNVLAKSDVAIESSFDGWKLLIFSSNRLPTNSQRINEQFFLWGVFQSVGEHNSSSQPLTQKAEEFDSLPGFMTPITNACNATSPALLSEFTPGFATATEPKEIGDSSDETSQKIEASETMGINAPWSSKRQRGAKGTATSKYFHDPSSQPQKPTKVTKSLGQADLLSHYHESVGEQHSSQPLRTTQKADLFDSPPGFTTPITSMLSRLLSSHGTTIAGLAHSNFGVVLGADGKVTAGDQLIRLNDVKIYDFGDGAFQMWGASAGTVSVCDKVAGDVRQLMQDAGDHIDKIQFLCDKMIDMPGDWEFVFAGKEQKGDNFIPFLFKVKEGKSSVKKEFYCCGNGKPYAKQIFKCIPCVASLDVEEAKVWVERALLYAAINDHLSGGDYCIKTIRADRDTETVTRCILTSLWRKHKDYFIQRFKDLGESDVISKRESKEKWRISKEIFDVPREWSWSGNHFFKKEKVKEPVEVPDDDGEFASMLEDLLQDNNSDHNLSHDEDEPPLKKQKPNEEQKEEEGEEELRYTSGTDNKVDSYQMLLLEAHWFTCMTNVKC
ncbi:hypothetical protein C5167_029832, partial [Papaver somniferum]